MRILHIEAGKHLYGGALQVQYLTHALSKQDVTNILASPPESEIYQNLEPSVVRAPTIMNGDLDWLLFFRIRKLIKKHQVDLVHIHSRRGADFFGLLAAKSIKTPVVISRRVDNKEPTWFARWKYHLASHVITISEGIRQVLLNQGVKPGQVTTVLSAVDTQKYTPKKDPNWFRHTFKLEDKCFVMAIMAQMIKRKGHKTLFEALRKLNAKNKGISLLIFGRGPLEKELKSVVSEYGLENVVQFEGFRNDLHNVLPNIDLVVHPAFTEGLGVALLQASSCGVPIVAGNAGGIPEIVKHGSNGWLFTPGDVDELAANLQHVIDNPEILTSYKAAGRDIAESLFSVSSMAQGNHNVYQQVLKTNASLSFSKCSEGESQ